MGCYRKLPRDGRTEFKRLQRKAEAQACYSKPEDQHKACYKKLSNGAKTQWDSIAWNHWPWTWLRGSNTPYIPDAEMQQEEDVPVIDAGSETGAPVTAAAAPEAATETATEAATKAATEAATKAATEAATAAPVTAEAGILSSPWFYPVIAAFTAVGAAWWYWNTPSEERSEKLSTKVNHSTNFRGELESGEIVRVSNFEDLLKEYMWIVIAVGILILIIAVVYCYWPKTPTERMPDIEMGLPSRLPSRLSAHPLSRHRRMSRRQSRRHR